VRRARGLVRLPAAPRPPIGVPDAFAYVSESAQLAPGEWLCALTDGVTEAMNERAELYGTQRLERVLGSLAMDAAPAQVNAAVLQDVERFVSGAAASDDLTLLALRWTNGR
jgi:sigma-B regulation protein RsbU (phosphoserine phosphatase)